MGGFRIVGEAEGESGCCTLIGRDLSRLRSDWLVVILMLLTLALVCVIKTQFAVSLWHYGGFCTQKESIQ